MYDPDALTNAADKARVALDRARGSAVEEAVSRSHARVAASRRLLALMPLKAHLLPFWRKDQQGQAGAEGADGRTLPGMSQGDPDPA